MEIYRLLTTYDVPEYVKAASSADALGDENTHRTGFADPINRNYPIHTKVATWFSAVRYMELVPDSQDHEVGGRIVAAAIKFGIADPIAKLAQARRDTQPVLNRDDLATRPDADFGLILYLEGEAYRTHPLRNDDEIKAAALQLSLWRSSYIYPDRRTLATAILDKAAAHTIDLGAEGEILDRIAGRGFCGSGQVSDCLQKRAIRLQAIDAELGQQVSTIAEAMRSEQRNVPPPDVLAKIADMLDHIDRMSGLDHQYADGLEFPEDVLYGMNIKLLKDAMASHVATKSGSTYAVDDLRALTREDCRDVMGSEFADAVSTGVFLEPSKFAAALSALDRPDALRFDKLASHLGIVPVERVEPDAGDVTVLRRLGAALAGE